MSRISEIIILCEDLAQERFARRFLKTGYNISDATHLIRVRPYPKGRGSGRQFVVERLGGEVVAYRRRHASTVLLVICDADKDSVKTAQGLLDKQLQSRRKADDKIIYVIPRWHIETWIAYLYGEEIVKEKKKAVYKSKYGKLATTKSVNPEIDKLAEKCKNHIPLDSPPQSLRMACVEFERIRGSLK